MPKKVHVSLQAPAPIGPYSQAVEVSGLVYCSGQIPLDPASGEVLKGPISEQTELVMKNIGGVLESAGLNYDHIVKTTIFLIDMADFPTVNEIYARFFRNHPPARSTIAVAGLPKGARIEIEVVAAR